MKEIARRLITMNESIVIHTLDGFIMPVKGFNGVSYVPQETLKTDPRRGLERPGRVLLLFVMAL